jgi:hypothetical protein
MAESRRFFACPVSHSSQAAQRQVVARYIGEIECITILAACTTISAMLRHEWSQVASQSPSFGARFARAAIPNRAAAGSRVSTAVCGSAVLPELPLRAFSKLCKNGVFYASLAAGIDGC